MISTMLVTVELRLMAIEFVFLSGLTGTIHRLDVNKVQGFAAAVKKNLALFITFFWEGKRVFDLTGLPTTCYDELLSHNVLSGRLTPATFTLNNTRYSDYATGQALINSLTDINSVNTSISGQHTNSEFSTLIQ